LATEDTEITEKRKVRREDGKKPLRGSAVPTLLPSSSVFLGGLCGFLILAFYRVVDKSTFPGGKHFASAKSPFGLVGSVITSRTGPGVRLCFGTCEFFGIH
jgi:hypothetical protein